MAPEATITSGLPDFKCLVLPGQTVVHEGQEIKPGKTFVCHASEANDLAARGYVEIKGTA